MQGYSYSAAFLDGGRGWSVLFAQEADEDLDFDEGLEDDDLDQPKPPSRRPLLLILVLLIAVGVGYWALQPDISSLFQNGNTQDSASTITTREPSRPNEPQLSFSNTISTPHFHEGQRVYLSKDSGQANDVYSLKGNALGTQPGPTIQPLEPLAIVDGEIVNQDWVYLVQTNSGKSGWVKENKLQAQP